MMSKRILFSTIYSEALKSITPFITAAKDSGYDVYVANSVVWKVDPAEELRKTKQIEDTFNINVETIYEDAKREQHPAPQAKRSSYLKMVLKKLLIKARIPGLSIGAQLRVEKYRKQVAERLIREAQPDVIFVTGDQSPIQKWLVRCGNKRGIPTINYQWNVCDANYKSALELLQRLHPRKQLRQRIVAYLKDLTLRKAGLSVKFDRPTFGGGQSKVFAVIGEGAKEQYRALGIVPQKMHVIGHPIYEYLNRNRELLVNDSAKRQQVYKALKIPADRKLILWCTNDQRTYYEHAFTYKDIFESWKSKLDILLSIAKDSYILIKIHPGESYDDYAPLVEGLPNVSIEREYNVWDIVPFCELMVVRFTSTAIPALCLEKPVISHNYPPIAGGSLYRDIGGTIHVDSDDEFSEALERILISGESDGEVRQRSSQFLEHFLSLGEAPSETRFLRLVDELIAARSRPPSRSVHQGSH